MTRILLRCGMNACQQRMFLDGSRSISWGPAREKLRRAHLRRRIAPYCAFTSTYDPGAFSIAFSLPSPGLRASTSPSSYCFSHWRHSGHQEPGRFSALASHCSGSGGNFLPVKLTSPYLALHLFLPVNGYLHEFPNGTPVRAGQQVLVEVRGRQIGQNVSSQDNYSLFFRVA